MEIVVASTRSPRPLRTPGVGSVWIIESTEVLLIEYALRVCSNRPRQQSGATISPVNTQNEYIPGMGRDSFPMAPLVEDIADFWCQYHLGKPMREWLSSS